ncbi:cyclin-domain-containing protein [Gilbertella persicaria]|nr:cyclin-domain-containing protein [Gilbertella persicaria]KAI8078104.1 cyclin-domain-containing protein [Gilbertella persicaria]
MNESAALPEPSHIVQVPEYYYAVDINYLTHMIADMLGRLIKHNDLIPLTPSNLTRFHSRIPPNISLSDYLRRIVKYTSVEKSCLLILLIYIDRVCELHPHFTISSLTVHRFLITAVTISSKALCDSYCTNSHYAKVGGISTQEINALELEFLSLIDWHLTSTGPILQQYYANLVEQHPCYERIVSEEQEINKKRRRSSTTEVSPAKRKDRKNSLNTELLEIEEETTKNHFDTLLDDETIPYIA